MLTRVLTAKGVLIPAKPANEEKAEGVDDVIKRTALWLLLQGGNSVSSTGTIELDSTIETGEAHHAILSYVHQLSFLLEQDEIVALSLNGNIMLTADTRDEPFVMRVTVRDGKIFYQDGHITWSVEVPF